MKMERKDIENEEDIKNLVHVFYGKVRENEALFKIFDPIIQDHWSAHLDKMTRFWSTLLLYTHQYKDDPLPKHLPLDLQKIHFDIWLNLFNETLDELFAGEIAENAKKRASSIARIMKAVKHIT